MPGSTPACTAHASPAASSAANSARSGPRARKANAPRINASTTTHQHQPHDAQLPQHLEVERVGVDHLARVGPFPLPPQREGAGAAAVQRLFAVGADTLQLRECGSTTPAY